MNEPQAPSVVLTYPASLGGPYDHEWPPGWPAPLCGDEVRFGDKHAVVTRRDWRPTGSPKYPGIPHVLVYLEEA